MLYSRYEDHLRSLVPPKRLRQLGGQQGHESPETLQTPAQLLLLSLELKNPGLQHRGQ